jgi:hypothetical protein
MLGGPETARGRMIAHTCFSVIYFIVSNLKSLFRSGQNQANYNDGHTISVEIELFGCDNYVLEESKFV